ncbi:MAG: hypothetical protein ABW185_19370 [Sedimenticola sp.]
MAESGTESIFVNFATRDELMTVPGIGPSIAVAIVELRASRGNMTPDFLNLLLRQRLPNDVMMRLDFSINEKYAYDADDFASKLQADAEQQTSATDEKQLDAASSDSAGRWPRDARSEVTFDQVMRPPPGDVKVKTPSGMIFPNIIQEHPRVDQPRPSPREPKVTHHPMIDQHRYMFRGDSDSDDEGHGGVPHTRRHRGPQFLNSLPKSLQYDGKSNWFAFKQKFTRYSQSCSWTADQWCLDSVCWCLVGKASDFCASLLERNPTIAYRQLLHMLEERFGGTARIRAG